MNKNQNHKTNEIVTSAKLSRKLLAAGVDPTGAAHHYWIPYDKQTGRPGPPKFRRGPVKDTGFTNSGRNIPAWTCGALATIAAGRHGRDAVDTILADLDGTQTREREVIARLGELILTKKAADRSRDGRRQQEIRRENWPTPAAAKTASHDEPFRKRFAAWWKQRPWARTNR